jgi:hypothetical protein
MELSRIDVIQHQQEVPEKMSESVLIYQSRGTSSCKSWVCNLPRASVLCGPQHICKLCINRKSTKQFRWLG